MTQQRFDNHYNYFYHDHNGQRRNYGIYSPSLDRFLHISDKDFWISFETASLVSSKINTIVYVIPPNHDHVTNENCLNFSLFNKTTQKLWTSNILVGRQNPALKMLYPDDQIVETGIHQDFVDNQEVLDNLVRYINYVYEQAMAIKISEVFYNPFNNKDFMENYLDPVTTEMISSVKDFTGVNVFQKIKNALYLSDSPEEANLNIINVWKQCSDDIGFMIEGYYKILNKPVPVELESYAGIKSYKNQSSWIT